MKVQILVATCAVGNEPAERKKRMLSRGEMSKEQSHRERGKKGGI